MGDVREGLGSGGPLLSQRRTMSVAQVAARLEHRLYRSEPTPQAVLRGCSLAVRLGLSGVIVRPEVVPLAGLHLAGTSVAVVTVLGWRGDEVDHLAGAALCAEAGRLVGQGATDLAVLADAGRLAKDDGRQLADEVCAVVDSVGDRTARVRVVLDTDGLTADATTGACELLGATGAWLLQGGSWHGKRTGFSRLQLMRAALPERVRLKWTFPVRSLDAMMIGVAEGVDRFNGDPGPLVDEAVRRCASRPLVVPCPEVDY